MRIACTVVITLFAIPAACLAGPEEIPGWIVELDSEDPVVRDRAERDLTRAGEPALAAADEAARTGSEETRARASRIAGRIRAALVLEGAGLEALKRRWKKIQSRETRSEALDRWRRRGGAREESVEALLKIARLDPESTEAALEALAWLAAPGVVRSIAHGDMSWDLEMIETIPTLEVLFGQAIQGSAAALERLSMVPLDEEMLYGGEPLVLIRETCHEARIVWRPVDGGVRFELVEEALAGWDAWWKQVRSNEFALMDIGLRPLPDSAALDEAGLDTWIERLRSSDPHRSRVARHVIVNLPDALLPAFRRRAEADRSALLAGFVERFALRHHGRIVFYSEDDGVGGVFTMNLDGSGRKRASGTLIVDGAPAMAVTARWAVLGAANKSGYGTWRVDLDGLEPPRQISREGFYNLYPDPTGRQVALLNDRTLRIHDLTTGRRTASFDPPSLVRWSPDGNRLVLTHENPTLDIVDVPSGRTRSIQLPGSCYGADWTPDGKALYLFVVSGGGSTYGFLDLETEKIDTLVTEGARVTNIAWSPDGRKFALARRLATERPLTVFEVHCWPRAGDPVRIPWDGEVPLSAGWTPDGAAVQFWWGHDPSPIPGLLVAPATRTLRALPWSEYRNISTSPSWGYLAVVEDDILIVRHDGSQVFNLTDSDDPEAVPEFLPAK